MKVRIKREDLVESLGEKFVMEIHGRFKSSHFVREIPDFVEVEAEIIQPSEHKCLQCGRSLNQGSWANPALCVPCFHNCDPEAYALDKMAERNI